MQTLGFSANFVPICGTSRRQVYKYRSCRKRKSQPLIPSYAIMSPELQNELLLCSHAKWVLVNKAWRVLSLRNEERLPLWRLAADILNKQSRTADKGLSYTWGAGRDANNFSP